MSQQLCAHRQHATKHAPLKRQYLKIGGELLAFNVHRNFSNALDGLVLVDLRKTDPARLETYMGKKMGRRGSCSTMGN